MNKIKYLITLVLVLSGTSTLMSAQQIPQFRDNEKVVMMGNSITHGGHYHSYIWLYYMTRFPERRIEIVNAGMGGECAWDMAERLDADVFGRKPSYVTLTFGMNDTGYFDVTPETRAQSEERIGRSLGSFGEMEQKLAAQNDFQTVMIGGSPYDETSRPRRGLKGKNDAMRRIISEQKSAAQRHGWGFVDFHEPMIEISRREQSKDSTFTFCRLDRIHPDCDGQMVMAYLFLKAQGLAGTKVADVSIRAGKGLGAARTLNCRISALDSRRDGVSFDYLANALPYPVDSVSQNGWANRRSARDAMALVPFMEEFNQELLTVSSLEEGEYSLRIDGEHIADLSSEQLAAGVNLAEFVNTPQYRQASALMYLNEERLQVEKRLVEYLWVEYEYLRKEGLMFRDDEEALDYLRKVCAKDYFLNISYQWYKQAINPEIREIWTDYMHHLTDKIYEMNKPVSHRIELVRTVKPAVDTTRVLRNPLSGWVMYLSRGWDGDFWEKTGYDEMQAVGGRTLKVSDYATVAYVRTSWSSMEPEEGKYFWTDPDSRISRLLRSAQSRGLKLAFRIVVDGRDQGQNTPLYVRDAGAEGFETKIGRRMCFTAYADDPVFQEKYAKFITALAERFNDADEVEFIDAYGLGKWGEGHAVVYKDPANKQAVFDWITDLYSKTFTRVPLFVHYHRLIGDANKDSWGPVAPESYRMLESAIAKGYSLRHDAFGMTGYYQKWEEDFAKSHNFKLPILMEGGWITGAHHRYWIDPSRRYREGHPEDVREGEYEISESTHVNMMDLRAGNETHSWFMTPDPQNPSRSLVEKFITHGGYRLYPSRISFARELSAGGTLSIYHSWENMGWGYCPTNIPQMNQRYKVAFALLDGKGDVVCMSIDEASDLSRWIKGKATDYDYQMSLAEVARGRYTLAVALVDVWRGNRPAIEMAVQSSLLTEGGWLKLGQVKIR